MIICTKGAFFYMRSDNYQSQIILFFSIYIIINALQFIIYEISKMQCNRWFENILLKIFLRKDFKSGIYYASL